MISGKSSMQSGVSYKIVGDNDMTLGCPVGMGFDWNTRRCYCKEDSC
jgi:hypothetical protein